MAGLPNETHDARHLRHMSRDITLKPERGLEPLTYRLQGDTTVSLKTPALPANTIVSGGLANVAFRLI